jgi:hypothetical protein
VAFVGAPVFTAMARGKVKMVDQPSDRICHPWPGFDSTSDIFAVLTSRAGRAISKVDILASHTDRN